MEKFEMKLCTDCKHLKIDSGNEQYKSLWKCNSPRNLIGVSLVDGLYNKRRWNFCVYQREIPLISAIIFRACGKSGRFWEQK